MSKYVTEELARTAHRAGILIGRAEPCAESKGYGWDVMSYQGKIIACVINDMGCVPCGEQITLGQLALYCDEPNVARWAYENQADIRKHMTCLAGQPVQNGAEV